MPDLIKKIKGFVLIFFLVFGTLSLTLLSSCGGGGSGGSALDAISRVSVDSSGTESTGGASLDPSISSDGRYVAFESPATNLVAGDTNTRSDIFVRDELLGTTIRVSVDSSGTQATGGGSYESRISSDGRYVVFDSDATNLVAVDTNGNGDVFIRDMLTNTTTRVSVDTGGGDSNGFSYYPSISMDGSYVAFQSDATNLVAVDTNGNQDVFIRNMLTNTTTLVSVSTGGVQGDGNSRSFPAMISSDGRYVAFQSSATNLVFGDTNGTGDIFVRDTVNNTTTRVSVRSNGTEGDGNSYNPSISGDGRYVAFQSTATNLVAGDGNGFEDVFLRDTQTNTTTRVSVDTGGGDSDGDSFNPSIDSNGGYVVFESDATNLVAGDTNGANDIFVRDTVNGTTIRVSVDSSGSQATGGGSFNSSISMDGRYVAFQSDATNLVAGDTNALSDIFRAPNQ